MVAFDDVASQAIEEDERDEEELEAVVNTPTPQEWIDYRTYKPTIIGKEWILSETDLCDFPFFFHVYLEIDRFWFFFSFHNGGMWCFRNCWSLCYAFRYRLLIVCLGRRGLTIPCVSDLPTNPTGWGHDPYRGLYVLA